MLAAWPETTADAPRSIALWPPDAYDAYASAVLAPFNPMSSDARDLKRFFFNFSHDTELDAANRVMIPPSLMDYAGLDKDVVVTGSGECLEVFDRAKYNDFRGDVMARARQIAESLGHTS